MKITIIVVLIILIAYFIVWPLSKKRPILLTFLPHLWLVYGIGEESIKSTLQKSAVMGRAQFAENNKEYLLTDISKFELAKISPKLYLIKKTVLNSSKKEKLLETLFKKMILNNFIA